MTKTVRTMALCLSLLGVAGTASAQSDLEKKRDEKLQEAWFTSNDWTNDYDVALERSKKSGKVIFAYFTRSYSF